MPTPLGYMDHFNYGRFVRVTPGNPWKLQQNQYAFEEHHPKFETHVQELRPSPVVPYLNGLNMPTPNQVKQKVHKLEDIAAFNQLLFRPYRCLGCGRCDDLGATASFCQCRKKKERLKDANGIPRFERPGRESDKVGRRLGEDTAAGGQ